MDEKAVGTSEVRVTSFTEDPESIAAYADWTGYRPANPLARLLDPNRWQPLPTPDGAGQRFLVPHWGLVAPFALGAGWYTWLTVTSQAAVAVVLLVPHAIWHESTLSFLGLGISPPDVSWGLLVNEGIQVITPIKIYWWLVLFPSLVLVPARWFYN